MRLVTRRVLAVWGLLCGIALGAPCSAQEASETKLPEAPVQVADPFIEELVAHAAALAPLLESRLAREFLNAAPSLPSVNRMFYRDPQTRKTITAEEREALPEDQRADLVERPINSRFYYCTGYGSPLIYARCLDVLARHGVESLDGRRVMDFGYGMIGQGRLMAMLGADVHGVEVEPFLTVLYGQPGDTGPVVGPEGKEGKVTLHHGRWPADEQLVQAVGGEYDVILSKNTLKLGYIHPAREADPSRLVHLGVSDEDFLQAVKTALKPGGLLLVYNISPKQNPEDQPYLPHADGKFPFERELVDRLEFEVLAWDEQDDEVMRKIFAALGLDQGKGPESLADSIFTHYTVLRRP